MHARETSAIAQCKWHPADVSCRARAGHLRTCPNACPINVRDGPWCRDEDRFILERALGLFFQPLPIFPSYGQELASGVRVFTRPKTGIARRSYGAHPKQTPRGPEERLKSKRMQNPLSYQWMTNNNKSIRLLSSFLGFFDIKLGVTIICLISLLNKVVGFYGILAIFHGANLIQISMYLYNILTIGLVIYGLQATGEENPRRTFIYANSLLLDHLISTLYLVYFGVEWYFKNPHDGRREAHGDAQKNMMNPDAPMLSPELRKHAAQAIWKEEQGFASAILGLVWLTKLYFIFVVYSFALHLRRGTYTALPLSRPPSTISTSSRLRAVSRTLNPNSSSAELGVNPSKFS